MTIDVSALGTYTELVKEYGPEFVTKLLLSLKNTDKVSLEDIAKLKESIKKPEEYEK